MTEPICEVIITADNEDWLMNFTRSLVEDRLVACGQHIAPIRSIYRWDGTIHDDREMRVALHTRTSLVQKSSTAPDRHTHTTCPAFSPSQSRPGILITYSGSSARPRAGVIIG